jgi:inosine-uridine nucleoside N-ribohydrolase
VRLWIDTDVGDNPDDAVTLLCAGSHPAVEVVGVSTTGGRTEWRAEVAQEFVDTLVVPGEKPDEMAAGIASAEPDALLAIGPLTNVAALAALGLTPPTLTVMGGALEPVRHRGRLRRVESNFGRDPAAAALVVATVALDVTVAMRLGAQDLAGLVASKPLLAAEVERWAIEQHEPVVLHDPLALLVAVGEPFVRIEPRRLLVDRHDGAVRESADGCDQRVVTHADAQAAIRRLAELLD